MPRCSASEYNLECILSEGHGGKHVAHDNDNDGALVLFDDPIARTLEYLRKGSA
jgi:hypothetical protein